MPLDGQVAIVAGASRGIGADIAKYLARAGAHVAVAARTETVSDPRLPGTIHSVSEEIAADGGTALPVVLNLRDPESIAGAVQQVVDAWGRVDILVNNAAIFGPGDLETVLPRHIELSLQVNLRGPILAMRAVVPHMKAAGGGHIINVSSRGSTFPGPGRGPGRARTLGGRPLARARQQRRTGGHGDRAGVGAGGSQVSPLCALGRLQAGAAAVRGGGGPAVFGDGARVRYGHRLPRQRRRTPAGRQGPRQLAAPSGGRVP